MSGTHQIRRNSSENWIELQMNVKGRLEVGVCDNCGDICETDFLLSVKKNF